MNFKTTGLLIVLLLIVGGVWLFVGEKPAETPAPDETAAADETSYVFDPPPENDDIAAIRLERPNEPTLAFVRVPQADDPEVWQDWRAESPLDVPVLGYTVDTLVSTFTRVQARSSFEPGAAGKPTLAEAGLEDPVATVVLADRAGEEYRLEIGRKAAISNDTYVRAGADGPVFVASRDLHQQIDKDFSEFRDKKLISGTAADAVQLILSTPQQRFVLTRAQAGADWILDEPVSAYAAGEQVMALLRKLTGLRAQAFFAADVTDLQRYGLDDPYLTARLTTEQKTPVDEPAITAAATQPAEATPEFEVTRDTFAIEIGDYADMQRENRFARLAGADWIVTVKETDVEQLVPELTALRDPAITRVSAEQATALTIRYGDETAELAQTDGRWRGTGDLAELDSAAVRDVLEAFEDLRAHDYITEPGDLSEYGLAAPRAVVTVRAAGDVEPVTVRIGAVTRSARNAYVQRDGQPTVFVVSAAQANRLAVAPLSLRSRQIFSMPRDNIESVAITHAGEEFTLTRTDGEWTLTQPDAPLEKTAARTLIGDLSRLRARRVVSKDQTELYGLNDPALTVRFTTSEPDPAAEPGAAGPPPAVTVEHELRVSRKNNVAYAQLAGSPYVFELDETIWRVLTAELIHRDVFDFSATDVTGITIAAPGGTLAFSLNDESEWIFTPDPYVELSQKKMEEFTRDLAGLRAEDYLAYRGGDFGAYGLLEVPATVSIKLIGNRMVNLKLDQQRRGELPCLAGWVEERSIFRLRPGDCEKLMRGLDAYLQPEPDQQAEE